MTSKNVVNIKKDGDTIENFIFWHITRHKFTYPSELARLLDVSWYKANRALIRLKKKGDLIMRRAGKVKIFMQG